MTRWEILHAFIAARGYTSFLEIGTDRGETFRRITCPGKVSVDPDPTTQATFLMTSDEFFAQNHDRFDVIFIDGLPEKWQALRDALSAIQHVTHNGVILMHDCLPTSYLMQLPMAHPESSVLVKHHQAWTGDVWKAFLMLRLTCSFKTYVIDEDLGCGVIDVSKQTDPLYPSDMPEPESIDDVSFNDYLINRMDWMNVRTWKSVQEELEKEGEDNGTEDS